MFPPTLQLTHHVSPCLEYVIDLLSLRYVLSCEIRYRAIILDLPRISNGRWVNVIVLANLPGRIDCATNSYVLEIAVSSRKACSTEERGCECQANHTDDVIGVRVQKAR